jgi:hypothetical protein
MTVCRQCSTQNPDGVRFCNGCGSTLAQGCSKCGSRLGPGARFCESCGAPVGVQPVPTPVEVSDKAAGESPLIPKGMASAPPPGDFRHETPRAPHEQVTPAPPPLYGSVPPDVPTQKTTGASGGFEPWRLGVAALAAAVFLYNISIAIFIILYTVNGSALSRISDQFLTNLALGAVAIGALFAVFTDRRTSITVLLGGIVLRVAVRLVAMLIHVQLGLMLVEWLVIGAAAGAVLWSMWMKRQAGDVGRLSAALTVLVAAQAATVIYGVAMRPSYAVSLDMLAVLAVTGGLVVLRLKLPTMLGPGAGGPVLPGAPTAPAMSAGFSGRRILAIIGYMIVAVLIRLLLRAAFK